MKDDTLSRIFLVIPLSCASVFVNASPTDAFESLDVASGSIAHADSIHISDSKLNRVLIAQKSDTAQGNITPEKIRSVVEITLRQKWHAPSAADGAKAVVHFTIMKSGQLFGAPSLKTSAGVPEFDQACIDATEKLAPLPALPPYLSDIAFVATFHAGKAPWAELAVSGEQPRSTTSSSSSSSGQSGWTQPSGVSEGDAAAAAALAATGQSDWTQPSGSSAGQSGWTQPSGSSSSNQSSWNQPSGNANRGSADSGELQAQPLGLVSAAQSPGKPPEKTPPASSKTTAQTPAKNPPGKNQKPPAPASSNQNLQSKHSQNQPQSTQQQNNQPPQQNAQQQNQGQPQQNNSQPPQTDMSGSQDLSQRVVLLNNNAVVAIADNNYEAAIKKLEEALKIDPTYQQARANLAIAYNNYGLQLKDRPDDAIKVFHKAFALDPGNEKTKINLDTIIQYMGKNPRVFKDRLDLGNKALAQGDRLGARIEYEAALAIKPDPITQQKLYAIINGAPMPPSNGQNSPGNQAQATGQPVKKGIQVGSGKPVSHAANPPVGTNSGAQRPNSDATTDGAQTGVSQKLDTMYRNLKNLEVKTFGKPFESDDVLTRLSRLEQKLLGKAQQGKPMRRLDALLILQ